MQPFAYSETRENVPQNLQRNKSVNVQNEETSNKLQ